MTKIVPNNSTGMKLFAVSVKYFCLSSILPLLLLHCYGTDHRNEGPAGRRVWRVCCPAAEGGSQVAEGQIRAAAGGGTAAAAPGGRAGGGRRGHVGGGGGVAERMRGAAPAAAGCSGRWGGMARVPGKVGTGSLGVHRFPSTLHAQIFLVFVNMSDRSNR